MNGDASSDDRALAEDVRSFIEDFRAAGGQPFHEHPLEEVRELYSASCVANGLRPVETRMVTEIDHDGLRLRLYDPTERGSSPTPVILFLHGGGWVMGDLATHDGLVRRIATTTALPVLAVEYRLAPEHPYPAAIDDARSALEWLRYHASAIDLEVESIVLMGDSAGGQLAAVLGIEASISDPERPVTGQVLLYPVTDIAEEGAAYARVTSGFPLVADTMRWFIDAYVPDGVDRRRPDLSPLRAALTPSIPPAYILTVDHDPLADDGAQYAAALASAGASVTYRHLVGHAHGLFTTAGRIPASEEIIDEVCAYIRRVATP